MHRNVKLKALLRNPSSEFQTQNMERVVAAYFDFPWYEDI